MESKNSVSALNGKVIVTELEFGEQKLDSGIVLLDDNGKLSGIHSRWAKVYSVGDDVKDISPGEYVLLSHGRWSRTIEIDGVKMNLIDYPSAILAISDERPAFVGLNPNI